MGDFWKSGFHLFLYELITSKQYAAVVLRRIVTSFIQKMCFLVLFVEIILHIPLAYDIPFVPKPDTSNPLLHLYIIFASVVFLLLAGESLIITKTIYNNLRRQNVFFEKKYFEDATFFAENITVKKDEKNGDLRYYPTNLNLDDVYKRALGYYGMSLGGEIFILITIGLEYVFNIFKKVN